MLDELRRRVSRLLGREAPAAPDSPLLIADHEQIRDIARQMHRAKVELDRSVLTLRQWARDMSRRLDGSRDSVGARTDLRALGETVGGLAHNFNNSLAAIVAYTELLLREVREENALRRLNVIREVALEASATVRRLQEFVSGQPEVAFGPVGLPAVITEALELTAARWRDDAQRRGVVIAARQEIGALPPVEGNAFALRDALVHLILDAVARMPTGGTLSVRAASEESGWVAVEVADTGDGASGEPGGPGGGSSTLGHTALAEVREIMERHGGTLTVERAPSGGTVARLRLHASRFQIIPPPEAVEPVPPDESMRILLVDDDERLLGVLSDMLRSGGHRVTTASSGLEALTIFDPTAHDVVITDLGMPHMTGWEVAERVKQRSGRTAVFLLTGWGESVMAGDASRFVDQVIAKPISAKALLGQLASLGRPGSAGA
jgi:CheY-like chemotaxis protein/signal transduction histidine kinase